MYEKKKLWVNKLIYKSETEAFKVKLTTDIKYYLISTFLRLRILFRKKKGMLRKTNLVGGIRCILYIEEIGSKSYYKQT